MKAKFLSLFALLGFSLLISVSTFAQGTAFIYQGRFATNGISVTGSYDFRFGLFDSSGGGIQQGQTYTNAATAVSNGVFTVILDFGNFFPGANRWLEIAARTNGSGSFTLLTPRQQIFPTPYAMTAASAAAVPNGTITTAMLAPAAVTGDKIAAGAVQAFQIDDGGNAAYQGFQKAVQSADGNSLAFSEIYRIAATNGVTPTLSLSVGGSTFGTVVGFSGEEEMSKPFSYIVEVQSSAAVVDPATKVGLQGRLSFTRNGRTSYYGGIVTGCTLSGQTNSGLFYTVRIQPRLAYLGLTTDYRIYQNLKATDTAQSVYQSLTADTLTTSLISTYSVHENLIQYNETSLAFFNRLMEEEGIFYLFDHSTTVPGLILADAAAAYLTGPATPYYGNSTTNIPNGAEYIRSFQKAVHESTLKSTVNTYSFPTPALALISTNTGPAGVGATYEFGTSVKTAAYVQQIAGVRQGRQAVERALISGSSAVPELHAGYTISLTDNSSAGLAGTYLITSVRHAAFIRVTNGVNTIFYGNQFEAIPSSLVFRPPLATPKPQALPCTAVVTGPAGETIYTDQYGRVKVQFHWDRYGIKDENSSAWLRVATPAAGGSHSTIFLPRVGDEVLVSFIQGDPDLPLVTGSLFNGANTPPYALPGNKTVSTIKSVSTGGQVNEMKFDDTAGSEAVTLHAGKQLNLQAVSNIVVSASRLFVSSPMSINSGTMITNFLAGQTIVGSCPASQTNFTITFPKTFSTTPRVIATSNNDPNFSNVSDTFTLGVRSISTTSFVVNVVRVDSTSGWSQALRINWIAWE